MNFYNQLTVIWMEIGKKLLVVRKWRNGMWYQEIINSREN